MRRPRIAAWLVVVALAAPASVRADELLNGTLATDGPDYQLVSFEVPEGIREIEIRHPRLSDMNVLDYGLMDPERIRGWGGGNEEAIVVGETAASRSYLPGAIVSGTWNVVIGQALVREAPRYELEIILRTEPTLAAETERGAYAPVTLATGPRWFAGDFHVHSLQSGDAAATLDEIAELASQRGLDFVVITDHNTNAQVDFLSAAQARHPEVLLIPGVEITTYAGHANGIDVTSPIDHRVGTDGIDMTTIADRVFEVGGLFSINHPVLDLGDSCLGCAWEHDVSALRVEAVEIGTGAAAVLFIDDALTFWDQLLRKGAHAAAIGGSDDHRAGQDTGPFSAQIGSPTTMVYADELSARAIVDAVRRGRTVVKLTGPDDPMIEFASEGTTLTVDVTGAAGATLRWVKNGRAMDAQDIAVDTFRSTITAEPPASGEDRYRAELSIDGVRRVVTSHVFVSPPEAGCACSGHGHTRGSLALLLLMLLLLDAVHHLAKDRR